LTAKMLRRLGAAPVMMGPAEVGEALARGTVDGTVTQFTSFVDFGLSRIVSNHYLCGLSSAELLLLMNKKKFDALPKAAQDIIRKYSGQWVSSRWVQANSDRTTEIISQFSRDRRQHISYPTSADRAKLKAAAAGVTSEWLREDRRNPGLLALLDATIAKVRASGRAR